MRAQRVYNLNLGIGPYDFEKSEIEELIENFDQDREKEEEDEEDEDNGDFLITNEQDNRGIILYYYSLFKNKNEKIFPKKSKEYQTIFNYFNMRNFDQKNIKNLILKTKIKILILKIQKIIQKRIIILI